MQIRFGKLGISSTRNGHGLAQRPRTPSANPARLQGSGKHDVPGDISSELPEQEEEALAIREPIQAVRWPVKVPG